MFCQTRGIGREAVWQSGQASGGVKWGRRRIRGVEKVHNSVILTAIGINLGRLWAYFLGGKVVGNEITGRGKPMINTVAAAISLAVNIPLNLLLIPKMGISGAALASTISYAVTTIIVLIAFLRISKNSLFDTIVIKSLGT